MKTLQETLDRLSDAGGVGQSLRKHFNAVGITEWGDFTRSALYDLKDHLAEKLAPGTQKTILAHVKSLFARVKDEVNVPADYAKILTVKATPAVKTYLTEDDLDKFAAAKTLSDKQEYVKNVFLICAYTGLRVGDAMRLTEDNVVGNSLHYVAQKTKKAGAIPLKSGLMERIKFISEHPELNVTLPSYNRSVRAMCKRANINEDVVVFKGGKELKGPKWKFVSSHTARISTATCLNRRGVSIGDIKQLLKHSSVTITEHYIIQDRLELSENAMQFFA